MTADMIADLFEDITTHPYGMPVRGSAARNFTALGALYGASDSLQN